MRVIFSGKQTHISDRDRDYAERKLQRLTRYFNSVRDAHLLHSVQRNWHIIEVLIDLNGTILRAEERTPDFSSAVDQVVDKLEHQLRRLKDRVKQHKGRAAAPTVAAVLADFAEEAPAASRGGTAVALAEEEPLGVVRRKRFAIKSMTVDEASLELELLHHDFHAFLNDQTGEVNVLYRRRDGGYGLLELEEA
jgi:putative sigma-54 modulation protein